MKKLFIAMGVMTLLVMHSAPTMAAEHEGFLDRVGDMFHADADEHKGANAGKQESDEHARDGVRHESKHGERDGVEHEREHEKHGNREEHDRD